MIFSDNIKRKRFETFIPFNNRWFFYENCAESDIDTGRQGRMDPVLKLYDGCEVMLTENTDVISGLANGTQAIVQKVVVNPEAEMFYVKIEDNIRVRAVYASDIEYIQLRHKNTNIMPPTFQIKPKQTSFQAFLPIPNFPHERQNKSKKDTIPMQATQIPIVVNNATTGHKLQGTSVTSLFVHSWYYGKNWPYVVLSRVQKLSGLYLRTKISKDLSKYMMHPDLVTFIEYLQTLTPSLPDYNTLRDTNNS
jgi:hypothetical protein